MNWIIQGLTIQYVPFQLLTKLHLKKAKVNSFGRESTGALLIFFRLTAEKPVLLPGRPMEYNILLWGKKSISSLSF
jgi:hypothetical protein